MQEPGGALHTWDESVLDSFDVIASPPPVGTRATLTQEPAWMEQRPPEIQALFARCVGTALEVLEVDSNGLVVLDARASRDDSDGPQDDIRVEAELLAW